MVVGEYGAQLIGEGLRLALLAVLAAAEAGVAAGERHRCRAEERGDRLTTAVGELAVGVGNDRMMSPVDAARSPAMLGR